MITMIMMTVDDLICTNETFPNQARSWLEILEGAPSATRENFGATPFIRLPHASKLLEFAYVIFKILS